MTPEQIKIADHLTKHQLCHGVGTKESHCTIAAINLSLTGKLTDDIPECVSPVIGRWVIIIQDSMPLDMLNSNRWRSLVPLIAGTGRELESERRGIILEWMWGVVLPEMQPIADKGGFGSEWQAMTTERTPAARAAATAAARAATAAEAAYAAAYAAASASAASAAADAYAAASASAASADARGACASAASAAAAARADVHAAADAADAARAAARGADAEFWGKVDPCGLLEKLIEVGETS